MQEEITLKKIALLFVKVLGISTLLIVLLNFRHYPDWHGLYHAFLSGLATALLWVGIGLMSDVMSARISWIEQPAKRLFVTIAVTLVYTFMVWYLIVVLWNALDSGIDVSAPLHHFMWSGFRTTLFITIFITLAMHGRGFLIEWKQAAAEAERLKKEQISARFEMLKNQVNPHFLFNSLNVLTTLVHKDADQAEKFVRQLSAVFRYVLDSRNSDLVLLKEELKQLGAYIFLMKIRFGESFDANLPDPDQVEALGAVQVAPLCLQMLVENAVKHNEVSKARPLQVEVFIEKEHIVVRNNLQVRSKPGESSGVGLENIKSRYQLLSDKPVLLEQTREYFEVKIPLLNA